MKPFLKRFVALLAVVAVSAAGYLSYRNKAMDNLYAEAVGSPAFYRGSQESRTAVKKLATYRGVRSSRMLLEIALTENPLSPEAQTEAIDALRERQDPDAAVALARLIQPYEGLKTRMAAATALRDLPCRGECISSILHYLERIWRGEPNYEDGILYPEGSEDVAANLKKEQAMLYDTLYSVLKREKVATFGILGSVYGLGSVYPSTFALDLTLRLGLSDACPYLLASDRQINDSSPEYFKAPRQELQRAMASLKCR